MRGARHSPHATIDSLVRARIVVRRLLWIYISTLIATYAIWFVYGAFFAQDP